MTNGCICCTLRDDLLNEVRALAESRPLRLPADRMHRHLRAAAGRRDLRVPRRGRRQPLATSRGSTRWSRWSMPPTCCGLCLAPISSPIAARRSATTIAHAGRSAGRADRVRRRRRPQQGRSRDAGAARRRPQASSRALNPDADIVEANFGQCAVRSRARHRAASTMRRRSSIRSGTRNSTAMPTTCRRPRNTASQASSIARARPFDPGAGSTRFLRDELARRDARQGPFLARDAAGLVSAN